MALQGMFNKQMQEHLDATTSKFGISPVGAKDSPFGVDLDGESTPRVKPSAVESPPYEEEHSATASVAPSQSSKGDDKSRDGDERGEQKKRKTRKSAAEDGGGGAKKSKSAAEDGGDAKKSKSAEEDGGDAKKPKPAAGGKGEDDCPTKKAKGKGRGRGKAKKNTAAASTDVPPADEDAAGEEEDAETDIFDEDAEPACGECMPQAATAVMAPTGNPTMTLLCSKCGDKCVATRAQTKASGTSLRCNKCKSRIVQLCRVFGGWPTLDFKLLSGEEQQAFYASIKEVADARVLQKKVEDYFTHRKTQTFVDKATAEWLPLSVWKSRGYDTEIIELTADNTNSKKCPRFGMVYAVSVESNIHSTAEEFSRQEVLSTLQDFKRKKLAEKDATKASSIAFPFGSCPSVYALVGGCS